jgi:hypothetical protein
VSAASFCLLWINRCSKLIDLASLPILSLKLDMTGAHSFDEAKKLAHKRRDYALGWIFDLLGEQDLLWLASRD